MHTQSQEARLHDIRTKPRITEFKKTHSYINPGRFGNRNYVPSDGLCCSSCGNVEIQRFEAGRMAKEAVYLFSCKKIEKDTGARRESGLSDVSSRAVCTAHTGFTKSR